MSTRGARTALSTRLAVRSARVRGDLLLVLQDALTVAAAFAAVLVLRFDGRVPAQQWDNLGAFLPVAVAVLVASAAASGLYGQIWRYASILEARRLVLSGALALLVLLGLSLVVDRRVPLSVVVLGTGATIGVQGLLRFQTRLFAFRRRRSETPGVRVLVLGAGAAGASLVRDMLSHPGAGLVPVGFLDDDARKQGRSLLGVRVVGALWELPEAARRHEVQQAVLAVGDASQDLVNVVSRLAEDAGVALRVIPRVGELAGSLTVQDVRDVQIDDLLGRQQVETDLDAVRALLQGRRVLITGAGGSIGSEIARQVAQCDPASLLLLDHDETHLHDVAGTLGVRATQLLVDIRDRAVVHRVIAAHRPQIVFHAAAHKHVPLLEDHPSEAVKTNVEGTRNVVDASATMGVERLVFISTDKAVRPSSVMGASKAVGEQLVLRASAEGRRYSAVRFGNVLGSRGSVIPTFVRQIQQGGPVTITDPRMTRFFMSIPEAVQLVLQTATMAEGGEVFMLEMGEPVKIMDLAQRMIRLSGRRVGQDVEIRITGVRPGEKLVEELSTPEEGTTPTSHPSIVRLAPVAIAAEVLEHEVDDLAAAAAAGLEDVVRASVFAIATRQARRRRRGVPHQPRRVVDLAAAERTVPAWTRSTT